MKLSTVLVKLRSSAGFQSLYDSCRPSRPSIRHVGMIKARLSLNYGMHLGEHRGYRWDRKEEVGCLP